ncbi:LrgB family protein [Pontibacter sp. JAM-7]|uniref:LrgB family protein n=1 Tax=Pontibacter sp. JAM-7 TaxID=3366581 RepID=UPI003AF95012
MLDWSAVQPLPALWLVVTLIVFLLASWVNAKAGRSPFLHPVLVSLSLIILLLIASGTGYRTYMLGGQYIHFLLGPAVVALAVPLYDNRAMIRRIWLPLLIGCLSGAVLAAVSVLLVGMILGLEREMLLSLAPKSVTSPIAIAVAEKLGGYGSLAAGLVLITGALACLFAPWVYRLLKVDNPAVKGFALGVGGHAMGTAFAFEYGVMAGAFAGLAMAMTGAFTAFFLPFLVVLLGL